MAARWDLLLVGMAVVHGMAVLLAPNVVLIALGVWWNSNTVAHNFIHRPFFRSRTLNVLFATAQSVLIGVPQTLWRERHLAHHAGVPWRFRWSARLLLETALITALWMALAASDARFFATVYMPAYLGGLALCLLQGHYEHVAGTTSHYGRLYNALCFNDGYHVEHHAFPGVHWTALPQRIASHTVSSRWPPVLRWLDHVDRTAWLLGTLERLVLRIPRLQAFVLRVHRDAFRSLLDELPPVCRVAVVGGGLFPRTAIVLRELAPHAEITVIEANRDHVDMARNLTDERVNFQHAWFTAARPPRDVDLLVIPLAFEGDRAAIYRHPPAPAVLVHDWAWRRRGRGRMISFALLKRLNLVRAA
jgi:hypothetical protein